TYRLRTSFPRFLSQAPSTPALYTLSLHDALPICSLRPRRIETVSSTLGSATYTGWNRRSSAGSFSMRFRYSRRTRRWNVGSNLRSEEHTSELQSRFDLVCRLLLEKKKTNKISI